MSGFLFSRRKIMTLDDLKEALSGLGDKAEEKAKELAASTQYAD